MKWRGQMSSPRFGIFSREGDEILAEFFLGRLAGGAGGRIHAARGHGGEPANPLIFQLRRASFAEGLFGLHGVSVADGTQLTMISSKWRVTKSGVSCSVSENACPAR